MSLICRLTKVRAYQQEKMTLVAGLTAMAVPGGCPNEKCDSNKAYFYQLQTRSADEPPTSFFKVRPSSQTSLWQLD